MSACAPEEPDEPAPGDEQEAPDTDAAPDDAHDLDAEPEDGEQADDPDPTDEPDATSEEDAEDGIERLAGEPTTERSERDGTWGDDLRIVDVRIGTHDGFDRVTFELEGDGEAGWWIDPDDEPVAQGSGEAMDVTGTTALIVAIQPLPYPEDGELTTPDRVEAPDGTVVLTEVVQDSLFEGLHRFALGLEEPAGYVVEVLDEPQRVVLDLVPTG